MSNDSDKVNLTSTIDDEFDDDTTPIPEAPPPDIADAGLINRFVIKYVYFIAFVFLFFAQR